MAGALVPGVAVVLGALVPGAAVVVGALVPGAAVAVGSVVVAAPPLSHAVITSRAAATPESLKLLILYLRSRLAAQSESLHPLSPTPASPPTPDPNPAPTGTGAHAARPPPRTARSPTAPDPSPYKASQAPTCATRVEISSTGGRDEADADYPTPSHRGTLTRPARCTVLLVAVCDRRIPWQQPRQPSS